jgi:glycerol-1-phosphate dehydrogenase [NAD(P)+]
MARTAAEALLYRPDGIGDDGFLTVLAEALVLSGMAMSVAGTSRPSSGACHEISHAIDMLHPDLACQHGEQVGIGAAVAWHLRGDAGSTARLVGVLRRHGLPTLPADLGLDLTDFAGVVAYAPRTRPGRYTIIEHLDLDEKAIRDAIADYVDIHGH